MRGWATVPDESRLSGIADALEEDDADEPDESPDVSRVEESDDSRESHDSGESVADADDDDPVAFSFEEADKISVYGTGETLEDYRTALDLAKAEAIQEHDLSGIEGRELHNAALQVACEHVDEIAEQVATERQE